MGLTSQPLVSVVTPVYNTEKYLAECIESVIAQTYENWEYVIVNNCSTDASLKIAERYAEKDIRIRVHNNENFLSLMQNWNHAMCQVSHDSKYCKVVHADDWLFPECIARMVEVAEEHPSVGIVGGYRLDEDQVNLDGLPFPSTVVPGRKICRRNLLTGHYVFGSPTSLLIRSKLIANRKKLYNESNLHADKELCFNLLQHSDFGFVHQVVTFTRRHNETESTFARRFDTYRIGKLAILTRYGPLYLSSEEYEKRLKQLLHGYHVFLARAFLELRGKELLTYHKKELAKLGFSISLFKIVKALFFELLDFKSTVKRVKKALD